MALQVIHKHKHVYVAKIQMPETIFRNINHANGLQQPITATLLNAIIPLLGTPWISL